MGITFCCPSEFYRKCRKTSSQSSCVLASRRGAICQEWIRGSESFTGAGNLFYFILFWVRIFQAKKSRVAPAGPGAAGRWRHREDKARGQRWGLRGLTRGDTGGHGGEASERQAWGGAGAGRGWAGGKKDAVQGVSPAVTRGSGAEPAWRARAAFWGPGRLRCVAASAAFWEKSFTESFYLGVFT